MRQTISLAQFYRWLDLYAQQIEEHEEYLTELDAAIGDADHGINMQRGMSQVRLRIDSSDQPPIESVGTFLRTIAMTLISSVGGAAGPLYGAFFLRAASTANNGDEIDLSHLAVMFRSGLDGVKQRGKAEVNDKTMIDVLEPSVIALEAAVDAELEPQEALANALQAAQAGLKHTIELEAQKGRASYLGPRSIGHQDPGATSSYYLIEAAAQSLGATEDQAMSR